MDEELAWETVDARVAYTCPGFDVVHEEVRLPDGTETNYDYVDEPPAVVVLGFTPSWEVVVIEEWRQAVSRVNRGLPAGTVEDGERLEEAARRELREETGHVADEVCHRFSVEPANGIADSVHHHFVATGCTPDADTDFDHDESIRVDTASFAALREAALAGDLRDGRATLAVLHHALGDDDFRDPNSDCGPR
jgi:ADP-ribose pyrophosphatase